MTEYRAIVRGVQSERPIQTISRTLADIDDWCNWMLSSHPLVRSAPAAVIEVYEATEVLIKTRRKEQVPAENAARLCQGCGHAASRHLKPTSASDVKHGACATCECKNFQEPAA